MMESIGDCDQIDHNYYDIADVSVDGNEGTDDADIDKGDNAGYAQDADNGGIW